MMNNIVIFDKYLIGSDVEYIDAHIKNEFVRRNIKLDYFKIDKVSGKISFRTPWDYFHEFVQKTNLSLDVGQRMEDATYNVYVHFKYKEKKGTIIFNRPKLLSANNYGSENGYEILLQMTDSELKVKEGWL